MNAAPPPTSSATSPLAHTWGAADEDTRRLCEVLVPTTAILALATVATLWTSSAVRADFGFWMVVGLLGLPTHLAVILLARHGRGRQGAILLCAHMVGLVWAHFLIGGPSGPRLALVNVAIIVIGWLLSERLTVVFAALSCAVLVALGLLDRAQWNWPAPYLVAELPHLPFVRQAVVAALIVAVMRRGCDRLIDSVRGLEARNEAAIEELRHLNQSLAQAVDEQTIGLVTTRNQAAALATEVVHALEEDVEELRRKLLHATSAPLGNARRCDDVQLAARSADRLGQMVDNLATYARLGEVTLSPVPIDMAAVAAEVVAMFRATADGARVAWQVDALPPAFGDEVLIRSVLENLVANAVKFSRREAAPRVHLGYEAGGRDKDDKSGKGGHAGKGRYFVADNGVGFDSSGTNRLFAPFCRLHDRKKFEGQGMGLANVRHIVERHYGDVAAKGQPGVGATFSFSLPPGENWC